MYIKFNTTSDAFVTLPVGGFYLEYYSYKDKQGQTVHKYIVAPISTDIVDGVWDISEDTYNKISQALKKMGVLDCTAVQN